MKFSSGFFIFFTFSIHLLSAEEIASVIEEKNVAQDESATSVAKVIESYPKNEVILK